jgi:hypothetical protein
MAARTRMLAACLHWVLMLFLAVLPFELRAGIMLGGLTFTNVEALALAALAMWAALLVAERRQPCVPRALALGCGLFLAAMVASALLAGEWRADALKFCARQLQGMLLGACFADQVAAMGWPLLRRLGLALVVGAGISAACGLLEITEWPVVLNALAIFKDQPTTAGGLLRLSATFAYANIAAMYYEAILPIALVGIAVVARWRARAGLAIGAAILYLATLLTYSRAALLSSTAVVAVVVLAALAWRWWAGPAGRAAGRRVVGLGALLAVVLGALLTASPTFRVRIAEPDVDRWYRAEYAVAPIARLAPNELIHTPVTVRNAGLVAWRSDGVRPIRLAYHWLDAQTRLVVRYNGHRTPLPQPVAPGESARFDALVQAPEQPGRYLLIWDMVSEASGWFSERGTPVIELPVTVAGAPASHPQRLEVRPPPPARRDLWSAALRFALARPALGIGPDVFRHVYGPALGLAVWDDRIHTNNLYIELLVGTGAIGLAIFLGLIAATGWAARRVVAKLLTPAAAAPPIPIWALVGASAALAAFLLHGLLDMFLEYSATYMLLWILLGVLNSMPSITTTGSP